MADEVDLSLPQINPSNISSTSVSKYSDLMASIRDSELDITQLEWLGNLFTDVGIVTQGKLREIKKRAKKGSSYDLMIYYAGLLKELVNAKKISEDEARNLFEGAKFKKDSI